MTDIKLSNFNLSITTTGDVQLISEKECLLQDIKLEAITTENELFYAPSYGWSLLEFVHQTHSKMLKMEIENRIKQKLEKRKELDTSSIKINTEFTDDNVKIEIEFSEINAEEHKLILNLNRVEVEVIEI